MNIEDYEKTGLARYERLAHVVEGILEFELRRFGALAKVPQTQRRAKDIVSLRRKLAERQQLGSNAIEDQVKDLAGCRIVFYTATDLERFRGSEIWNGNFDVDWRDSKTHFPRSADASVDDLYQGIHFVVRLNGDRTKLVEYSDLAGLRCEVQLQTILNHAWSETSHDVLYKPHRVEGFGERQEGIIRKRFARVMRDYLMPAGYEMQKIQEDAERLRAGQEIFDGAPLQRLGDANDNNERVDLLKKIKVHILPGLDDVSVYLREIRNCVSESIEAARTTPVVPRTGVMGTFRGATASDVLKQGLEVLDEIRYGHIEDAFLALGRLWDEATEEDRKEIEKSVRKIAKYDLEVWRQIGARVQLALLSELNGFTAERRNSIRPLVLAVCSETLKTEMEHAEQTSFDTVTFSRASVNVHDALVTARDNAVRLTTEALQTSTTSKQWREAWSCCWSGTQGVSRRAPESDLQALQLGLMRELCGVVTGLRHRIPRDVLQEIEEALYWADRRLRKNAQEDAGGEIGNTVTKTRCALTDCRDQLNLDERYVKYKTLVGFRTVFAEEWDREIEYDDKEAMRQERIDAYAASVTQATQEEWHDIVSECAATESDDLATFPPLTRFLKALSESQPAIALDILLSGGKPLEGFAPSFLPILVKTAARADALNAMQSWISTGRNAGALGRALFLCDENFPRMILETSRAVVCAKDVAGCREIAHAALKHGGPDNDLWTTAFVPAVTALNESGNAAIASSYLINDTLAANFELLPPLAMEALLDNFVHCRDLGYAEIKKLTRLSVAHQELVWEMLRKRLLMASLKTWEDGYEAVPDDWNGLEKTLGSTVEAVFDRVRAWPDGAPGMETWLKSKFLAALYQDCKPAFTEGMHAVIRRDGARTVGFACDILRHFDGDSRIFPLCQTMVDASAGNSDLLAGIRMVIETTGVVSGEFGLAEAYEKKIDLLSPWLDHPSVGVQSFARSLIQDLEAMATEERRRGTERRERRKRDFDVPE